MVSYLKKENDQYIPDESELENAVIALSEKNLCLVSVGK